MLLDPLEHDLLLGEELLFEGLAVGVGNGGDDPPVHDEALIPHGFLRVTSHILELLSGLVPDVPGDYELRLRVGDGHGAPAEDTCIVTVSEPPRVTGVLVRSGAWSPAFLAMLTQQGLGDASYGRAVPDGPAQLDNLPWVNVDRISIAFSGDVNVSQGDLAVRGVDVPQYASSAFTYDAGTFTATWSFEEPIGADKLLHGLTFVVLSVWFTGLFAKQSYGWIAVGLMLFGLFIEACQLLVGYRMADWLDVGANTAGIITGLVLAVVGLGGWGLRVEAWYSGRQSV